MKNFLIKMMAACLFMVRLYATEYDIDSLRLCHEFKNPRTHVNEVTIRLKSDKKLDEELLSLYQKMQKCPEVSKVNCIFSNKKFYYEEAFCLAKLISKFPKTSAINFYFDRVISGLDLFLPVLIKIMQRNNLEIRSFVLKINGAYKSSDDNQTRLLLKGIAESNFSNFLELKKISLDLSDTNIEHKIIFALTKVFPTLGNITTLNLDFAKSKIDGKCFNVLAKGLSKLPFIEDLNLNFSDNDMKFSEAKILAEAISELREIVTLKCDFSSNSIEDLGAAALAKAFSKLQKIYYLNIDVSDNSIKSGVFDLIDQINKMHQLTELFLFLCSNYIGEEDDDSLTYCAGSPELSNISIEIDDNPLTAQKIQRIFSLMLYKKNIEKISISASNTNMDSIGVKHLCKSLKKTKGAMDDLSLYLSDNNITDGGAIELIKMVRFDKIKVLCLNLASNYIENEGFKGLITLMVLPHIEKIFLDLSYNDISPKGFNSLPKEISKLKAPKLIYLDFSGNNPDIFNVISIRKEIFKNPLAHGMKLILFDNVNPLDKESPEHRDVILIKRLNHLTVNPKELLAPLDSKKNVKGNNYVPSKIPKIKGKI